MVRRGRQSFSPRRSESVARAPRAPPTSNVPANTAPAPSPTAGASQEPSLFQQAAATAGGVAVGSAVGHAVGAGLTGIFGGSSSKEAAVAQPAAAQPTAAQTKKQPQGPCSREIKEFLQCAEGQADLTLCQGFNEVLRQCKVQHNMQ